MISVLGSMALMRAFLRMGRGRAAHGWGSRAQAARGVRSAAGVMRAKLAQVDEGVDPAGMPVGEAEMEGVAAHRRDLRHRHGREPGREPALDAVAGAPGAAAAEAQGLRTERRRGAVRPGEAQRPAAGAEHDLGRGGLGIEGRFGGVLHRIIRHRFAPIRARAAHAR